MSVELFRITFAFGMWLTDDSIEACCGCAVL